MSWVDRNHFYRLARERLAAAVDADERGNERLAIDNYADSCMYLLSGVRSDANLQSRRRAVAAIKNYLGRAEYLKECILSRPKSDNVSPIPQQNLSDLLPKIQSEKEDYSKSEAKAKHEDGFAGVVGLSRVKQALSEAVILPRIHPDAFSGRRRPWRGILLYGPPGTGKTHVAAALSKEAKCEFVPLSAGDIVSKYMGESERAVKAVFDYARKKGNAVIFIDEIDSIGRTRNDSTATHSESSRRLLTELLRQMDGFQTSESAHITVVAATNMPFELDPALRRRFEKRIYVPLPGLQSRARILRMAMGSDVNIVDISDADLLRLAKKCKGYSGSDLTVAANEALMLPVRRCIEAKSFVKAVMDRNGKLVPLGYGEHLKSFVGLSPPNWVLIPSTSTNMMSIHTKIWSKDFPAERLRVPPATAKDLEKAISAVRPSVDNGGLEVYQRFAKCYGEKNATQNEEDEQDESLVTGEVSFEAQQVPKTRQYIFPSSVRALKTSSPLTLN